MKKHILLVLLLTLFGQAGIAQKRVIKSPKVEAATHTNVIIDRIALSDTATVLDGLRKSRVGDGKDRSRLAVGRVVALGPTTTQRMAVGLISHARLPV